MALGFIALQACNSQKNTNENQTTMSDSLDSNQNIANNQEKQDFLAEAAMGGMMEIELGKLAQSNANNQTVKQFGAMMVADHTRAGEEIKAMLLDKGASLPVTLSQKHQDHITEFTSKKGTEFDKAYMEMMVEEHNDTIEKFETASENDEDAEVKAFAVKTLPVLNKHLAEAKKIKDMLND